jgi:adenine phosphoribosyltransferase
MLSVEELEGLIRNVPDFPIPGIQFKDITTVLAHPGALGDVVTHLENLLGSLEFNAVASIESRGFVFGAVLAARRGIPLVLVRKPGKLPADTLSEEYTLEYGTNTVEMHRNAVPAGSRVLIVDDLVATGGSAAAAASLIKRDGSIPVAAAFMVDLVTLGGAGNLRKTGLPVYSLMEIEVDE